MKAQIIQDARVVGSNPKIEDLFGSLDIELENLSDSWFYG